MACSDFTTYADFMVNGQFFDAIYCPYGDQLGGPLFAMLFFGALGMALYVYSGRIIVPAVLTIIGASVIIPQLGAPITTFVGIVITLTVAGAGYLLLMRRLEGPR